MAVLFAALRLGCAVMLPMVMATQRGHQCTRLLLGELFVSFCYYLC